MAITLYMISGSPPVRSVLLCAKALGLELNVKVVELLNGDHLTPEYRRMNPQHTVPLLDDDGFILTDSHAIMAYLVSRYGKDKSLYPEDPKQRAIVDHRLHFDTGILFERGLVISRGIIFEGVTETPQKMLDKLGEAFDIAEKLLEKSKWVAGDQLTIADFSWVTTLNSWSLFVPLPEDKYPRINAWMEQMKALPYYNEANQAGLEFFQKTVRTQLEKNFSVAKLSK